MQKQPSLLSTAPYLPSVCTGRWCNQDDEKALHWLTHAADQDHADALCELANVYARGKLGVVVDQVRAAALLLRAAELGNYHAMFQIGNRFEKVSVVKNRGPAVVNWKSRCVDQYWPCHGLVCGSNLQMPLGVYGVVGARR